MRGEEWSRENAFELEIADAIDYPCPALKECVDGRRTRLAPARPSRQQILQRDGFPKITEQGRAILHTLLRRQTKLTRQDQNPVTELSSAQPVREETESTRALEPTKKPFVEPVVSLPLDVLEATAFFQGSAVLDVAGL